MKTSIHHLIAAAFIALVAAGCTSAPSRFYTLSSTAVADGSPALSCVVAIDPVSIPAEVDRSQFTVQVGPNQVEVNEFNRWAAPLNEAIARAIAGDLSVQLGTPRVASAQLANFNPDYRVAISIQRFDSVPGKSALVEALWVVRKQGAAAAVSGRTIARETVTDASFDALTAAHSRALAKVSADITAAIRAKADEKP